MRVLHASCLISIGSDRLLGHVSGLNDLPAPYRRRRRGREPYAAELPTIDGVAVVMFRWRAQSPVVDSKRQTVFAGTRRRCVAVAAALAGAPWKECLRSGCVPYSASPDALGRARGHEGSGS